MLTTVKILTMEGLQEKNLKILDGSIQTLDLNPTELKVPKTTAVDKIYMEGWTKPAEGLQETFDPDHQNQGSIIKY